MPTITRAQALRTYAGVCGPAKRTQHLAIVTRYLDAGGGPEDAGFARYLRGLEAGGMRPSTVDLHRRIIRAFWRANGLRPPHAAVVYDPEADTRRPGLAPDLVRALIAAARTDAVDPWARGLLAVATLYGPRAVELSWVRASSWRAPDTLFLRAAKGSRDRVLWWPPGDALGAVRDGPWPVCTVGAVERQMDALWSAAGVPRPDGVSWHAIRRGLNAALAAAGVDASARRTFMGWGGKKASMEDHYARPSQLVGADGALTAPPAEDPQARDAAVWAVHPFVAAWA